MDDLKKNLGMEEDTPIPADYKIPYFVHQDDMNRLEHSHKKVEKWLFIICLVIFLALVGTNAYWIWENSQYEDIVVTQENTDGFNNFIGNDGNITN